MRPGDLVLEVGAASTLLGFHLADLGCRVVQVDAAWFGAEAIESSNRTARARDWPLLCLHHDMASPLPFVGGAFDVCFCVSVLEHLRPRGRRAVAARMGAALRPGGVLALTFDWIRRRGRYPAGLRFRERERILDEIVRPSGCEIMGNEEWVDDESDENFCGALFLRKPGAPSEDRLRREAAVRKLWALAELAGVADGRRPLSADSPRRAGRP